MKPKVEHVLFFMMAMPFALAFLCHAVNAQWLLRHWLRKRKSKK